MPNSPVSLERHRRGCATLALLVPAVIAVLFVLFAEQPELVEPPEPSLFVQVKTVQPEAFTPTLSGFGVVEPLHRETLAAEVAGRILSGDQGRVRSGFLVREGDLLLQLDDRDLRIQQLEAAAGLAQAKAALQALELQQETDTQRRAWLSRARELQARELERVQRLFLEDQIGSQREVDLAEQALTQSESQLALLDQALALFPLRREEMKARVQAAEAMVARIELDTARTAIRAPFSGRIETVHVETGDRVMPGQPLLTLVRDDEMEIRFPLELGEARRWLPFLFEETSGAPQSWFPPLPELEARLFWREGRQELSWQGQLHRVVALDPSTRMLHLAIRTQGHSADDRPSLPLTPGMFVRIELPGRPLSDVYTLPQLALNVEGNAYRATAENRLETVPLEVLRSEGGHSIVRGLQPGDRVVITRLVAPLEGALLEIEGEN